MKFIFLLKVEEHKKGGVGNPGLNGQGGGGYFCSCMICITKLCCPDVMICPFWLFTLLVCRRQLSVFISFYILYCHSGDILHSLCKLKFHLLVVSKGLVDDKDLSVTKTLSSHISKNGNLWKSLEGQRSQPCSRNS